MAKKRRKDPCGSLEEIQNLASATEQTGLIPAAPGDEAQAEAYEELWPLAGQKPKDA